MVLLHINVRYEIRTVDYDVIFTVVSSFPSCLRKLCIVPIITKKCCLFVCLIVCLFVCVFVLKHVIHVDLSSIFCHLHVVVHGIHMNENILFSVDGSTTVEPRYNEVLGTMKITLLPVYQVSHYIRVKKTKKYKELGPAKLSCYMYMYKRVLLQCISDLFIARFHCSIFKFHACHFFLEKNIQMPLIYTNNNKNNDNYDSEHCHNNHKL